MSKDKTERAKYLDDGTRKVRGTLVIPPAPTPTEVHKHFHKMGAADNRYEEDDSNKLCGHNKVRPTIYPTWAERKMQDILPGPMKIYTKEEIEAYLAQRSEPDD